ncbi:MAG: hypothetical protein ABIJ59_10635 [Pseudomonadota bacterium]
MSNISSQFSPAGFSSRQNALSDAQFSSYIRQQSVTAQESMNAGLTIKTREGDIVTLTSNSYAQLDAYSYNSKGIIETDQGATVVKQNHREITLTSGDSFSFSVVGDLNEDELKDIEAIVKDIDEIISQMAKGDMDDAVAKAMTMGGYDSVLAYSADITYEKSYAGTTQTQAQTQTQTDSATPIEENNVLPEQEKLIPLMEPFPENTRPWKNKSQSIKNFEKFIEKMTDKLEAIEDRKLEKAKDPIDKLFGHHLGNARKNNGQNNGQNHHAFNGIKEARKQVKELIEQMTSQTFELQFSAFIDQQNIEQENIEQ